jgi:hypothetical protein
MSRAAAPGAFTVTTAHVMLIWICIGAPVMAWHFWLHS